MSDSRNNRDYEGFEFSDAAFYALGEQVCVDHFDDELNGTPDVATATLQTNQGEFTLERNPDTNYFEVKLDGR
jgi:hypothetical protein